MNRPVAWAYSKPSAAAADLAKTPPMDELLSLFFSSIRCEEVLSVIPKSYESGFIA